MKELSGILQERRPEYIIAEARQNLDRCSENLQESLSNSLNNLQLKLQHMSDFLARATPMQLLKPFREKLKGLEGQLLAYHPYGPLTRGYAIVTLKKTGEILRTPDGLNRGDKLKVQLQKGSIEVKVHTFGKEKPM